MLVYSINSSYKVGFNQMKSLCIIQKFYNTNTSRVHHIKYICGEYLVIKKNTEDTFEIDNLRFETLSNIKKVIDYMANLIKLSSLDKKDIDLIILSDDDKSNELLDSEVIMSLYNKKTTLSRFTYNTMRDIDQLIDICKK